jgi:hypothetical protein
MKRHEAKSDTSSFHSNVRAEDGLRRNPEAYSLEEILIPLGVIAMIFLCCLLLALIRC